MLCLEVFRDTTANIYCVVVKNKTKKNNGISV